MRCWSCHYQCYTGKRRGHCKKPRGENHQPYHVLHFATKKDGRQTITLCSQYCRESLRFYPPLLYNKTILAGDPNHLHYKDPDKPAFHHERNHGWPNENRNVTMNSKLMYERKLGHWKFVWVYGKPIRENQAEKIHVAAIDPLFSRSILPQLVTAVSVNRIMRLSFSRHPYFTRYQRSAILWNGLKLV